MAVLVLYRGNGEQGLVLEVAGHCAYLIDMVWLGCVACIMWYMRGDMREWHDNGKGMARCAGWSSTVAKGWSHSIDTATAS